MSQFEIKQTEEQQGEISKQMLEMNQTRVNENRDAFTSDELVKWDKLEADYNKNQQKLETLNRTLKLDKLQSVEFNREDSKPTAKGLSKKEADRAFRAWCLPDAERKSGDLELMSRAGYSPFSAMVDTVRFDQTVGTNNEGGYTVNGQTVMDFEKYLKFYSGIRQACGHIVTDTGEDRKIPVVDTTSRLAVITDELDPTEDDPIVFQTPVVSRVRGWRTGVFEVSYEVLQDSQVGIENLITDALSEAMGRGQNKIYTQNLSSDPIPGLVDSVDVGKITTSLDWEACVDLIHSVDPAYRNTSGVGFMAHDLVVAELRKMSDENGMPAWQPSLQLGVPDRFLGYPIYPNSDMSDELEEGDVPLLFGLFSKAEVRDVGSIRIQVLREQYALHAAVGYIAYMRSGFHVKNPTAIKSLVIGTPSS